MLGNLDPAKLLIILVLALVVVGPERLPKSARQAGSAWRELTRVRQQVVDEVRSAVPELDSLPQIPRLKPGALSGFLNDLTRSPGVAAGAAAAGAVVAGAAAAQAAGAPAGEVTVTGPGTDDEGTRPANVEAVAAVASPPFNATPVTAPTLAGGPSGSGPSLAGRAPVSDPADAGFDDPAMN